MARREDSPLGHDRDNRHHDRGDDPQRNDGQDDAGYEEHDRDCRDNGIMMLITTIVTRVKTVRMPSVGAGPAGLVAATLGACAGHNCRALLAMSFPAPRGIEPGRLGRTRR